MIYVGNINAKLSHFTAAISSDSKILIEPLKFTYNYDGFYLPLSNLVPLDQNSSIISLEPTAHYGNNLVRFLINKDSSRFITLKTLDHIELKEFGRFRQKTVKQRTRLKIQLAS